MHKTYTSHNRCGGYRALRNIAIAFLISLLSAACTDSYTRSADKAMDHAETLMETAPDSALALLDSLDPSRLHGERRKALHALLITQARDKNYIDQTSDTLLLPAVEYFDSSEDQYHRMLAHYYLSRIKFYNNSYPQAMREAEMTLSIIETLQTERCDTDYWRARVYNDITDIAYNTSNFSSCISTGNIAIDIFNKIGLKSWETDVMFKIIRSQRAIGEWPRSEQLLESVNTQYLTTEQELEYRNLKIGSLIHNKQWDNAEKEYNLLKTNVEYGWDCLDESKLAYIYANQGHNQKAQRCIQNAYTNATTPTDTFNISYYDTFIHLINKGDYAEAEMIKSHLDHAYREATGCINNHMAIGDSEYQKFIAENASLKNKLFISYIIITTGLFFAICFIVAYIFVRYHNKKKKILDELLNSRENLKNAFSDLQAKKAEADKQNMYTMLTLKSAFDTIVLQLNKLCKRTIARNKELNVKREYSSNKNNSTFKVETTLMDDLSKIIPELNSSLIFETLEISLNYTENDLISKFRQDFPALTEQEFKLILLIFSNIGSHTICLILGIPNLEAFRNRKARLKKLIDRSDSSYKSAYIQKKSIKNE